jgi:hypothetical protein
LHEQSKSVSTETSHLLPCATTSNLLKKHRKSFSEVSMSMDTGFRCTCGGVLLEQQLGRCLAFMPHSRHRCRLPHTFFLYPLVLLEGVLSCWDNELGALNCLVLLEPLQPHGGLKEVLVHTGRRQHAPLGETRPVRRVCVWMFIITITSSFSGSVGSNYVVTTSNAELHSRKATLSVGERM